MASTTIRARRVTEPTVVQRHPYQLDDEQPLAELATAWDNITEAKSALYRAEARFEHHEDSPGSLLEPRHPAGARLPVDSVPSVEIRSSPGSKVQKKRNHPYKKPRKKVTIQEDLQQTRDLDPVPPDLTPSTIHSQRSSFQHTSNITDSAITTLRDTTVSKAMNPQGGTSATDLPRESSSRDILGNGSSNLSIGSSSEIRVLNDIRGPSLVRQASTVEVSPGLRVSKDYIPAYDRLFGGNPVMKLSQDKTAPCVANTPENRMLLRMISSRTRDESTLNHMDRLRERVQQQQLSASTLRDPALETQRKRHQEADPVRINSENETDFLLGLHPAPKVPVRKVASAPAAPVYRGFNQAEARFQISDGRIVTEDQLKRKTSRPNTKNEGQLLDSNQTRNSGKSAPSKPLQPLHRQTEDNQMHRNLQKPVRKVRKTPLPAAKPKKPDPAPGVGARAWREGQKTVIKVLGPPPKVPKQTSDSVQTKESTSEQVQNSEAPSDTAGNHTEDEVDRLSEHPIESDNEDNGRQQPEGQAPIVGHLPDEAHEVLNDLHLDDSDDGRDSSPHPAESKSSKNNNNVPRMSRKKKMNRSKTREGSGSTAPVQKMRHYEAEEVQKYMAKQRLDRRRRMQEDKRQRLLQAEKKKEKLEDLYKRQRDGAKTNGQKVIGVGERIPVDNEVRILDETFSKGQGALQQQQQRLSRPATLQRNSPYQENHRKIDTTGSDKENRAFWSTSSSDSSLRSSPQTDLSSSTSQDQQQAGAPGFQEHQQQHDIGRDIVLEPVKEEESLPVIKNQLNQNANRDQQPAAPAASSATARPRPAQSPGKPRSKAERIAALKATAAALQGRLENEVRQLTGDLSNLAANALAPGQSHQALRSPAGERWAYPIPGVAALPHSSLSPPSARPRVTPVPASSSLSQSATKSAGVRFSMPDPTSPLDKLTRHQKVAGANQDFNVFIGELPGVRDLFEQAQESRDETSKSSAATTIQAAYRGHQVRQKLDWELPSGSTLKDRIRGKRDEVPIPQIRLSTGLSLPNNVLQSDGESLSEGPLSAESSEAEVDQEYTPKFKSLPTRARPQHLHDSRQTNVNFGPSPQGPERDGLSVIDIYMKRYEDAQRDLMTRQRTRPSIKRDVSPGLPQSYSEDFTGGSPASSNVHSIPLDSPDFSRVGRSPIPSSASADSISQLVTPRSRSSGKDTITSRPPTGRSISLPSPRDTSYSFADSAHSLNVSEKKRSRTPSPRPTTLRDAGTQTPPSSRSSPSSIKSRSSSSRGSHSPPSDARSPVSDHKSPVDEIRSLIEDLKKSTSNGESVHSDGVRSVMSPGSRTSQGHSPSLRTPADSPTTPLLNQGAMHRNAKSPVRREVLSHFKPISHPGSEVSGRSTDVSRSTTSTLTSTILQPGPKFYSPSALQLKMAAELNLLETLEESVRQLSEVERTRSVSLAHEESASLAKILQNRQRDHEKDLQLLSFKARQEVEEANRQLEEVKQKAAETALEAEQGRVKARKDAAAETRDSAQKLLMTQADAARITAEAAKQLAEAHKVSVSKPSPPPTMDAGQVAAESAKAAASAAVTAALEQQRLYQKDMLHEMRASVQPPPPVTRSVAAGNSRPSSMTPSRSTDTKTPSAHYSEDFTNTSSSHTPSSAYTGSSSQRVLTAQDSSFSRQSNSSKSIKTASDLSLGHPDQTDSIATASDIVADRDFSKSAASSSIRTESGAKVASSTRTDSISEDVRNSKSELDQYSLSFDDSDSSSRSSIPSVVSPSPVKSEAKKDSRTAAKHTSKDRPDSSDSMQSDKEGSFSAVTIEVLQKQLKEEEARSQQQVTLLKLREKVLVDKTNAELEWLEHQKRRLKEKDDQDGVTSLRKRQRALLSKLQMEQSEIKQMLASQRQASLERQRLLHQQQEIARMRRAATRYKDQMKDLPPASPNVSSILPTPSEEGDEASMSAGSMSDSMLLLSPPGGEAGTRDSTMDASAMEKKARVLQNLKMLQQPLSMKFLMKRETKLKKRRQNAEELLAWKQRLDEEEKHVAHMEHEVLHLWDGAKRKIKPTAATPSAPASSQSPARDTTGDGDDESEDYSLPTSTSGKMDVSRTASNSQQTGTKTTPTTTYDRRLGSSSDASIMEELNTSSIAEEIGSEKTQSKSITESPHAGAELSSDDTIKEASGLHEYTNDSFDSTADRTLTPSKHSSHQGGPVPPIGVSPSPGQGLTALGSSMPKSVSGAGVVPSSSSRRGPFLPRARNRYPSDSGSESEKSFSQTMSETASDQSDIEGRVRALKDALKRRKMEADRLRKQQKRLNREKLKAQEASLKKQLETYDRFVETTKAELEQESKKQKLQGSSHLLSTPSAKPQIKQPKAGTDSLRHARALRQRTASDSSQEGALYEARSAASIKGGPPSMSESGRSSRSSLEGGGVPAGEERVPSVLGGSVSYSSFSATSSPSMHHSEGGVSPKSPYSLSRDHSASASSSIAEDISIRSDYSDKESAQDSEKFDSEDHRKIKEKLQHHHREEEEKDAERTPSVPMINGRRSGDGRDAEEDTPKATASVNPALAYKPTPSPRADVDDDVSISSSVPEEIISAASIQTQDSFEESKSAVIISNLPESDHELSLGDSLVESPKHVPVSPAGGKATVTPVLDDSSQRSLGSIPSSVHSRSSRSPNVKSEASYSEDFLESSPTLKRSDSKSDTDEDISEHLSEVSEVSLAKSSPSRSSGHLVFDLKDKSPLHDEPSLDFDLPEVTVIPQKVEEKKEEEDVFGDKLAQELIGDATPEPKIKEVLPDFHIGDRVLIGGKEPGTLLFKGPTQFASGNWIGVELDEPEGTNDGTLKGIAYFTCKPNYGIFAPEDKIAHLPEDYKPSQELLTEEASEQSSIEEDLSSQSSVRTVSESDLVKTKSVSNGIAQEQRSTENKAEEDKESERSLSQLISIRSEDILEEATEDELSEAGIDDDALEKLISHAAEAVESFSVDEPGLGKGDHALVTPRGAPEDEFPDIEELPHEDEQEGKQEEAENRIVDIATDHLTEIIVKDTFDDVLELAGKQKQDEEEQKSKDSLLELLVSAEPARSDSESSEVLVEKSEEEIPEKVPQKSAEKKADSVAKSLINEAISEVLKLRDRKNAKIELANERVRKSASQEIKTPEHSLSPEFRPETPYTPDKSPERKVDNITPLDDDIFINRVHIESSSGSDNIPVARPGSPIFGESGSVSPEALNEKLEQLQLLDKDILEADLFGDQEWFDDDFGSMKKSQSIIKVPERVVSPKKAETPAGVAAQEAKAAAKQRNAKLDLKKIVDEPFFAVPHNISDVTDLASQSVKVFHDKVQDGEPVANVVPPSTIMGSDTKGSDIESTSRKAYKNLIFTLSGEVYQAICQEQEPTVQSPWMKPKRKPRQYFFQQPPSDETEMASAVEGRVLALSGLITKQKQDSAVAGSKLSKKKDHVDEILIDELKEEEPEWIDYDNDELSVKMQLADALFESLLIDTAIALHQIEDKRKARAERRHQEDHFSHHDVEF